jgi:hypothetical protein
MVAIFLTFAQGQPAPRIGGYAGMVEFSEMLTFLARHWNAAIDLRVLFWRDMLGIGTVINLLAGFAALIMLAQGVKGEWAVLVHLAPLPYNWFLLASVWRSPQRTPAVMVCSGIWFVAVMVF